MKESSVLTLLILLMLLCVSCGNEQTQMRETIPLVSDILDSPDSRQFVMLSSHQRPEIQGNIFVIGAADRCSELCDRFMVYDENDNVDGSQVQDGLPDFAGETVSAVLDQVNVPYSEIIAGGREDRLREVNVRNVLMAVDTVCHLSPYDIEGMSGKKSAKIVILTSPYSEAFGMFDIDTLLRSTGCAIKVLSPLGAMMDHLFSSRQGSLNIGVIPNSDVTSSGVYKSVFHEYARKYGRENCGCVVYMPVAGADPIRSFLDSYLTDGMMEKLDAILVDDCFVDMDAASATIERLTSVMSEESLVYGNCVNQGFELLDSQTAVLESCFDYLRKTNTFTHNIHYPRSEYFITVNTPGLDSLSYKLMRYDDKFVQE